MARPKPSGKHWIVGDLVSIAEEQGRSLESVALEADMSRNALYQWKSDNPANPTIDTVERIASILGYDLDLIPQKEQAA